MRRNECALTSLEVLRSHLREPGRILRRDSDSLSDRYNTGVTSMTFDKDEHLVTLDRDGELVRYELWN